MRFNKRVKALSPFYFPTHTTYFIVGLLGWMSLTMAVTMNLPVIAQMLEEDPVLQQISEPNTPSSVPQKKPARTIPSPKITLKGNITTLDTALIQEADTVDWYGWYMACRKYLVLTGGIQCPVGTKIRFNRGGLMTPYSSEPDCVQSVLSKRFPLPTNTKLEGVILPVRSSRVPPASPQELYNLLKGP